MKGWKGRQEVIGKLRVNKIDKGVDIINKKINNQIMRKAKYKKVDQPKSNKMLMLKGYIWEIQNNWFPDSPRNYPTM